MHVHPGIRSRAVALLAVAVAVATVAGTGPADAGPSAKPAPRRRRRARPRAERHRLRPGMPVGQIQATLDALARPAGRRRDGHRAGYALLFLPGTYGTRREPLQIKVGYYTEIAGLGAQPGRRHDQRQGRGLQPLPRRRRHEQLPRTGQLLAHHLQPHRSTSTRRARTAAGSRRNFWAVSQAVSMRRVDVTGGRPVADGLLHRRPAVRQRRLHRRLEAAARGQRFAAAVADPQQRGRRAGRTACGTRSSPASSARPTTPPSPNPPYTTLDQTPVSREKPYLFVDAHGRVPGARAAAAHRHPRRLVGRRDDRRAAHPDRATSSSPSPATRSARSTRQLARGKNLLLTPGRLRHRRSIEVKRPGTVVLGIGHATLTAVGGAMPLEVADVAGRRRRRRHHRRRHARSRRCCCGSAKRRPAPASKAPGEPDHAVRRLLPRRRPAHRQGRHGARGEQRQRADRPHLGVARRPRRRGLHDGVNGDTERWNTNTGRNGVVINGDDVTATGLFVEHFQRYNTIWNGERGTTVLYQNELPYDPPTQADWMHGRHARLRRLQGRRRGRPAPALRRRRLRVQPEQPVDPHRERVRGARDARRPAAPHHDRQPQRGHDRPRGQRRRRPGRHTNIGVPVYVEQFPTP